MNNILDQFLKLHKKSIYLPYSDHQVFPMIIKFMADEFRNKKITKVVGIESRGFVLAGGIAKELNCGLVMVRKSGNIEKVDYKPRFKIIKKSFKDYSGTKKSLEVENDPLAFSKKDHYLVVDDWIATGSQIKAVVEIIENIEKGKIKGVSVILNSLPENFQSMSQFDFLNRYSFKSLIRYNPYQLEEVENESFFKNFFKKF